MVAGYYYTALTVPRPRRAALTTIEPALPGPRP